jgi:hypothetical protein
MSNVIKFPFAVSRRAFARLPRNSKNGTPRERVRAQNGKNMHTFVFRSYDLIVESDAADWFGMLASTSSRLRQS